MAPHRTRQRDAARRLRTAEFGTVAPTLGWRTRGGGRAAWASPGRSYVSTTTQIAGLFPFTAGSGAPLQGVPLGRHMLWGESVCGDPFAWMEAGITTNTGVFVVAQPGAGKSAFAKRLELGLAAQGCRVLVAGDLKNEHTPIVELLGGQIIRIGRGLPTRINPLDSGPLGRALHRLPAEAAERLRMEVRGRRLASLLALCSLVRGVKGTSISNGEEVVLGRAVDLASADLADDRLADPTVPLVLQLLRDGPSELLAAAEADDSRRVYDQVTADLRRTLSLLLEGSLAGVFDATSTTSLDLDAPAVGVDISNVAAAGDTMVAAAMLATWSFTFGAVDAAQALADAGVAPRRRFFVVMDELWRALRGASGLVEHADAMTRLNRSRGIASLMATHSLRDLEVGSAEDSAKARGFVERSAIVVLGALPPRELDELTRVVPMTGAEQVLVAGWASPESWQPGTQHPGRGKYLIKTGNRPGLPLQMMLTPDEQRWYDTDALVRRTDHPGAAS